MVKERVKELGGSVFSAFDNNGNAINKHDWLYENGKNDWEKWYTYLEDKNDEIWKATLIIINAITREKILYDIIKIENVEKAGSSAISPHTHTISSNNSAVNKNVGDETDKVDKADDEKHKIPFYLYFNRCKWCCASLCWRQQLYIYKKYQQEV